jgi:hypothetical protein
MSFLSLGATPEEYRRPLPGDTLVPDAAARVMHAVTIAASPERVWPWLVQMGSGRAGWYSYDWIDNDGRPSATEIIPEFQRIAPGDVLPSLPGATDSFIVAAVDPQRDLVLTVAAAGGSWTLFASDIPRRSLRRVSSAKLNSSSLQSKSHPDAGLLGFGIPLVEGLRSSETFI